MTSTKISQSLILTSLISSTEITISSIPSFLKNESTNIVISNSITINNSELSIISNLNNNQENIIDEIIRQFINMTLEEIKNNINDIINEIEIGKKYEIKGENFNIIIGPTNDMDNFNLNISKIKEISKCENIIRSSNNILSNEILTLLIIESEKDIPHNFQFQMYDNKKQLFDLSYCKENVLKNFSIGNLYDLYSDDNKDEDRIYKSNKIVSSIRKNFIEGNLDFFISNYLIYMKFHQPLIKKNTKMIIYLQLI